jgi:hypothetical protein
LHNPAEFNIGVVELVRVVEERVMGERGVGEAAEGASMENFSASAANSAVQRDRSAAAWPKTCAWLNAAARLVRSEAVQVAAQVKHTNVKHKPTFKIVFSRLLLRSPVSEYQ